MQETLFENQQYGIVITRKLQGQSNFIVQITRKKSGLTAQKYLLCPQKLLPFIPQCGGQHQFINCLKDKSNLKINWNSQVLEIYRGGKNMSITFKQTPITHLHELINELASVKKRLSVIEATESRRENHFRKEDKVSLPMLHSSSHQMVKEWEEENERVYRNIKTTKRKTNKDEMIEIEILKEEQNIWNMKFMAIVKENKYYKCLKKDLSLQKYREFFGQRTTSISTFYKWIQTSYVSIEGSKLVARRENEQIIIPLEEQLIAPVNVTEYKFRQMLLKNQEQIKSLKQQINRFQADSFIDVKNSPAHEGPFEIISERVRDFENEMLGIRCQEKFLKERTNALERSLEQSVNSLQQNMAALWGRLNHMKEDQRETRISVESMEENQLVILNGNTKKLKRKVDKQDSCLSKMISYLEFFQQTIPPVNFKSAYAQNFKIHHNEIQYIGEYDDRAYQILGIIPIKLKSINKFTILVTEDKNIFIGIISRNYLQDRNSSASAKKYCILYFLNDGDISVSGHYLGDSVPSSKGSQNGEALTMRVAGNTISWQVEGEKRGSYSNAMICNPSIPWVPFVMMMDRGDKILWD